MIPKTKDQKRVFWWIVCAFVSIPLLVSAISTIHVINFFELSNYKSLAVTLALAFELGALSALAGIIVLDKINKNVVMFIFILLTAYQMMGNSYFAYDYISNKMMANPHLISNWTQLFGLDDSDSVVVKRILAIISGAILPIVSLCFLDLLVNYIQKHTESKTETVSVEGVTEGITEVVTEPANEKIVNNEVVEKTVEEETPIHTDQQEEFKEFLKEKKKRIEGMREPNLELLDKLYDGGKIEAGQELVPYSDFFAKINNTKHNQKEINLFLTLCNYLDICKLSGIKRIALKNYNEAKQVLSNYLSIGDQTEDEHIKFVGSNEKQIFKETRD